MKRIIFSFILLLLTFTSVSAVTINFNTSQNMTYGANSGIIYSNTIALEVTTTEHVICKHSSTSGTSFNSMTGTFEDNFETIHKKTFNLNDGIYRYFVKCENINFNNVSGELEIIFRISNPISTQINLEQDILNAGKHEIELITSKVPISTPELSYTYDGISYTKIFLYGSQTIWKGYISIPASLGEKTGSFKFSATEIGRSAGSETTEYKMFMVDTTTPSTISTLEATGEYGQIKLEWFSQEDKEIDTMNIYRSENPNVGYTDFYKTIDGGRQTYYDNIVSTGKVYYYRIAPKDSAGNLADLSREVKATPRTDNTTLSTGLAPELISLVDATLTELNLLEKDIQRIESSVSTRDEDERTHLKTLGVIDDLQSSKSELNALKKEITNYKLQQLTADMLDSRLASSRIKFNILKKKIPDSVVLTDSNEKEIGITSDLIRIALVEYSPELSPSLIDKSVKESQKLIEENNVKLKSNIRTFEITYLDGTQSSKSLIWHSIDSILEKSASTLILLKIPSTIGAGSIKIKNMDYLEEGQGLFRFETDAKEVKYIINGKLDQDILSQINIVPIKLIEESLSMTGFFLSEFPDTDLSGITILIILACSLVGYLVFIKKNKENEDIERFIEKARLVKDLQKKGDNSQASLLYDSLKQDYAKLTKEEKFQVFKEVKHIA